MSNDLLEALVPVCDAFDRLEVPYFVTGSLASTAYGLARSTLDADIVAELAPEHADPFAEFLGEGYHLDVTLVREAIRQRSSFNLVHFDTMLKIDVFVPRGGPVERERMKRRRRDTLLTGSDRPFWISSPEDTVLSKLVWFESGGRASVKQWADIVGVLRVQGGNLDAAYLKTGAEMLGVTELMAQARSDAGREGHA